MVLSGMIEDCLRINNESGADMLPTEKNADVLWQMGILAAEKGEPCLVAQVDSAPVGYTLWCELANPLGLDFERRVLHGLGTYVLPEHRRSGVAKGLRDKAEALAAALGFDKVVGVAYHEAGLMSVINRGWVGSGVHVEKVLS